jgi:hypothetical protein
MSIPKTLWISSKDSSTRHEHLNDMCLSKNALNTTLQKLGRPDKMIIVSVLIIVLILVYLLLSYREFERPIFLESVFRLNHMEMLFQ